MLTRLAWRMGRTLERCPDDAAVLDAYTPDAREAVSDWPLGLDLAVFVTTYARPTALARLLDGLAAALARAEGTPTAGGTLTSWRVLVVDDGSSPEAQAAARDALSAAIGDRGRYVSACARGGKQAFWRTHHLLHRLVADRRPRLVLFLQDDLTLPEDALTRALGIWRSLEGARARVLYLTRMPDDERWGRWIVFPRRVGPVPEVELTQWFDLSAFLVGPGFFEAMDHRVFPVPRRRWWLRPSLSSGVGEQYTLRLRGRGDVFQVRRTVVRTGREPSVMNPGARRRRRLDNYEER